MTRILVAAAFFAASLSIAGSASAAVIVITQSKVLAGGVTPGDLAGFPVTLSTPGAYRLDTNLNVPNGAIGIQPRTPHVDIDMNGFRLSGLNAVGDRVGNYGVDSAFGNGRIHDGFITNFRFDGIRLRSNPGAGNSNQWVVTNMTIESNSGSGISSGTSYHRFVGNTINLNSGFGIQCQSTCHVEGNLIADNEFDGVYLESGLVLGNTISGNQGEAVQNNGISGDVGVGNNIFVDNNEGQTFQLNGTTDLQPNACSGLPCN